MPYPLILPRCVLMVALICIATSCPAGVLIFQDDFDDGDAAGWTFSGNDSGEWGVVGGKLNTSVGVDDDHDGLAGIAFINGITLPDHFAFEADVSVIGASNALNNDFGHVGFAWGFDGSTYLSSPPSSAVMT